MASETPQRATREESRAIYGYPCTAFTSMNCTDGSFHLRAPRLHLSSLRGSAVYRFAHRYCTIASSPHAPHSALECTVTVFWLHYKIQYVAAVVRVSPAALQELKKRNRNSCGKQAERAE